MARKPFWRPWNPFFVGKSAVIARLGAADHLGGGSAPLGGILETSGVAPPHARNRNRVGNGSAGVFSRQHLASLWPTMSLVTLVIPAYNASAWIGETLESVHRQTYQHIEI